MFKSANWAGMPRRSRDYARDRNIRIPDKVRMELGLRFLKAVKKGDYIGLWKLLNVGAPVNFVGPVDHATALH
jgi:hypothetical protein